MNGIDLIFVLIIGTICGTIGQVTSGYARGGWIVHLSLGLVGAALGIYLSRALNLFVIYNVLIQHTQVPVIWCLIGSVLFVAAIGFLVRPSRH